MLNQVKQDWQNFHWQMLNVYVMAKVGDFDFFSFWVVGLVLALRWWSFNHNLRVGFTGSQNFVGNSEMLIINLKMQETSEWRYTK